MNAYLTRLVLVIGLLVPFGCATGRAVRVAPYVSLTFPPSSAVAVLHALPTEQNYLEIAEISVRAFAGADPAATSGLIEKAKEIGADAIVMIGDKNTGWVKTDDVSIPINWASAVAIRYKR